MAISIMDLTPLVPSENLLVRSALPDKAIRLANLSASLAGQLSPLTLATLNRHMTVVNAYCSNLIEGYAVSPLEIRAAQRGNYSPDPARRNSQQESIAHIGVQQWVKDTAPDLDVVFSPDFICQLHHEFYQRLPENLRVIRDEQGRPVDNVVPGVWRTRPVIVGRHVPPPAEYMQEMMAAFCENYHPRRFQGDRKLLAILAAHHRLTWIHPFLDGNGRVGRLWTDTALKTLGLESYGAWCLSRGFATSPSRYKHMLANADAARQGDYDGRGALTEKGLVLFCDYMLETAIEQVTDMSRMLDPVGLRCRMESYVHARNDCRVPGMKDHLIENAVLVLYMAFVHGEISRSNALDLCALPEPSARSLLSQLTTEGLLSETSSQSSLRWEIPDHAEDWYFPALAPTV